MSIKIGFHSFIVTIYFSLHLCYNKYFFVFEAIKDKTKTRQRGLNVRRKLTAAERLAIRRKQDSNGNTDNNDEDYNLDEDGKFEKLYA